MLPTYKKLLDDFKIGSSAVTKLKGFMVTVKAELYHDVYLMKQKTLSLKHILKNNKSCVRSLQSYMACLATNHSCSKKTNKKKQRQKLEDHMLKVTKLPYLIFSNSSSLALSENKIEHFNYLLSAIQGGQQSQTGQFTFSHHYN